jgi:hypothetical protein
MGAETGFEARARMRVESTIPRLTRTLPAAQSTSSQRSAITPLAQAGHRRGEEDRREGRG